MKEIFESETELNLRVVALDKAETLFSWYQQEVKLQDAQKVFLTFATEVYDFLKGEQ